MLTPSLALERTQYAKLKKFVKDQKKRTAKVSKKHEWTQRKSRLHQDAEDAENEVLANCTLLADNKDAQFGEVFMETLSSYETQEGEIKVLSHKVNGIIIAFLSAKNYIFSMLDTIEPAAEGQQDPVQVFASDIRSTFMSVSEEVSALREEEEALDQYIKKYSPLHSDVAVYGTEGLPDCRGVLDDLLRKYVIAETHVKDAVREDFAKLEKSFERKASASAQSSAKTLPRLPHKSRRAGGGGQGTAAPSISSSFMHARNEAAKTSQSKGRRALLKEISEILPHIDYSSLEKQNDQFQLQQQQRMRNKELSELHTRELKRLAKRSEERLLRSSNKAKKKASSAAACLEWELHADAYTQHLKHCRKERAIDDEIRAQIHLEEERRVKIEKEKRDEIIRMERENQKQMIALYRDEMERKRAEEQREREMKKLQEDHERAMLLIETEKRVKYRQDLNGMKKEERQAREELLQEEERAKQRRLERLAQSVAPEVEADPTRMRAHTYASYLMFEADQDEEGTAFNPVHGYFDERLFQDQRFRIGEALRAAGLHTTDYGRRVLTDIKSNVPTRSDTKTNLKIL